MSAMQMPAGIAEARRPVTLTAHAHRRCAQRGIGLSAVHLALRHGRIVHNAGARIAFFGRQELKDACADGVERRTAECLQGLVLLLSDDDQVITAYRNGRATADIRRKERYDRKRQRTSS